jgi:hypothetical protein
MDMVGPTQILSPNNLIQTSDDLLEVFRVYARNPVTDTLNRQGYNWLIFTQYIPGKSSLARLKVPVWLWRKLSRYRIYR